MGDDAAKLVKSLRNAKSVNGAFKAIFALGALAKAGDAEARRALAEFALGTAPAPQRSSACAELAEGIDGPDEAAADAFRRGLDDSELRYWCIAGLARTGDAAAREPLLRIARAAKQSVELRAQAIKGLARLSGQPFDQGLPSDPGDWKKTDLRLAELEAWADAGFPQGPGYTRPRRCPALNAPRGAFEEAVARLDRKLAASRGDDPANPANWLAEADPAAVATLQQRWPLPVVYADFLARFGPVNVTVETKRFPFGLRLFGADELAEAQLGYSVHAKTGKPLQAWPPHYLVIATHEGDPVALDLAAAAPGDAPVSMAPHGAGVWKFKKLADSFAAFLEQLSK